MAAEKAPRESLDTEQWVILQTLMNMIELEDHSAEMSGKFRICWGLLPLPYKRVCPGCDENGECTSRKKSVKYVKVDE